MKYFSLKGLCKWTLFAFLLAYTGFAQKISFDTFGYPTETVIVGVKGTTVFYVPVEDNVNYLNSYLHLEFEASQVIERNKSHITVLLNDTPIETRLLKNENNTIALQLPILKKYISSGFLKIEIKTHLRIGDEICEIYTEDGFWIKLTEKSHIYLDLVAKPKLFTDNTIADLLPHLKYILISDSPELEEIQYAAYISFYLKRTYGLSLKVLSLKDYSENLLDASLLLMPFEKLAPKIKDKIKELNTTSNGLVSVYTDVFYDSKEKKIGIRSEFSGNGHGVRRFCKSGKLYVAKTYVKRIIC
jgi:hypothetical protein